jgi:hypothetical protein
MHLGNPCNRRAQREAAKLPVNPFLIQWVKVQIETGLLWVATLLG